MLPNSRDIHVPLLTVLADLGGEAGSKQIRDALTVAFPQVLDHLSERDDNGDVLWHHRIRSVRSRLEAIGEIEHTGMAWRLTDKGRARIASGTTAKSSPLTLTELLEAHEVNVRDELRALLSEMTPAQFEHFARRLLIAFGFVNVVVTGKSNDHGIDGFGDFSFGLSKVVAGFQCKRYKSKVGPEMIRDFRGSMDGRCHHGFFFTTSDFTREAREEAERKSATKPIALFNGDGMTRLMIEKGVGVRRTPLYVYDVVGDELADIEE